MKNFLGIDIGTSGCKAVVFDESGHQVSSSYRGYDIISKHDGWAELDTDEVIARCFEVIKEAASGAKKGCVGMGISCQGEAFTLVDKKGKALCNALVSSDVRANEMIAPWTKKFGEAKLYYITGHTPHPMFSLFKLLWIKKNSPGIWKKASRILCFEDLLQFRLGIENPSMGWPLAGRTMLFDVVSHEWSRDILDKAGIDIEKLSIPLQSGTIAGYINKDIARELHLAENSFVVTGGHDQPCSSLGAGAFDPGIAVYSSGTVECVTPAFNKAVFTESLRTHNLCTYDHCAPGKYATVAFSLTGGNILKWFRDEFGSEEVDAALKANSDPYELLIDKVPDGPTRLLVLPYFTPSGTPYFDVSVKGAILGLDMSVTREEILKALLEGVALEIRLNIELLKQSGCEVKELRIIGGGARSEKHVRLKADVLGMPVSILDVSEAGCMGVAMLAMAASTKEDVTEISKRWVKPGLRIVPTDKKIYDKKFRSFKNLYPAIKNIKL
jgi:xylulokinase